MIWFTADWHLGHDIVMLYTGRPFQGMADMVDKLVGNFNEVVKKGDLTYLVGDMVWHKEYVKVLDRLNGNKVIIPGNHDKRLLGFKDLTIKHVHPKEFGLDAYVCHYPLMTWPGIGKGAVCLHGHAHGKLQPSLNALDVGVDAQGYYPISAEAIVKHFKHLGGADEKA